MEATEQLKIENKIRQILDDQVKEIEDTWVEAHHDLIAEGFIETISYDTEQKIRVLADELDSKHRKLYAFLSGRDVVDLLKAKMTDDQIASILINACNVATRTKIGDLVMASHPSFPSELEIFDHDLDQLVKSLPNDSKFKTDVYTVQVDVPKTYFVVNSDLFLKEVSKIIDDALAEQAINNLIEA